MTQPFTQMSLVLAHASGDPARDYRATFDVIDGDYLTGSLLVEEAEVLRFALGVDGQPIHIGPTPTPA